MQTPDWYLDELAYAGSEHLDTDYVTGYNLKAGTDPTNDLAVLRECGLNQNHTLVDMGAGTGTFALAVAPFCQRVIAIDVSPAMLSFLRQKATQENIHNIETVQAGFLSYAHHGELADFVYSRHALHHLPDFWKALALQHIAAILKPGGVLYLRDIIFSCKLDEVSGVIESWLANAAQQSEQGWTRHELEIHLRDEYSTFSWLLEPMLDRAGFKIQQVQYIGSIYAAYTLSNDK